MAPADDFVEDFVGADRALKRLALTRASEVEPAAGRQRPALHARPRRGGRPVAWERGGERHPVRTVRGDESLRDALSDLLRSPVAARRRRRRRGACAGRARRSSHPRAARTRGARRERSDDPRPVRRRLLPRPLAEHRQLRGQQRLLPGLDRPPPRPLRVALLAAPVPGRRVGRPRLRDRLRPRPGGASPAPARRPDHPGRRGSSTRSPASPSSSCCCRSPGAATPRRSSR